MYAIHTTHSQGGGRLNAVADVALMGQRLLGVPDRLAGQSVLEHGVLVADQPIYLLRVVLLGEVPAPLQLLEPLQLVAGVGRVLVVP